jgi:hypothetical protein
MKTCLSILALSFLFYAMTTNGSDVGKNNRVKVTFDESVQFDEYTTFNFQNPVSTDTSDFHTLLGLAFSAALEKELTLRGYVQSDKPDLLINVSVDVEDKKRAPKTNGICPSYNDYYWRKPTKYYRYSGRQQARLAESRKTYCDYTEGSVSINISEADQKGTIWHGLSLVRIDEKERGFLSNGTTVEETDGSISIRMDDVERRSTYMRDINRLSDDQINKGYLLKGYILDDVARMLEESSFPEYQQPPPSSRIAEAN